MRTKKTWNRCCLFHVSRLLHCPSKLNRQPRAHTDIKYTSVYIPHNMEMHAAKIQNV